MTIRSTGSRRGKLLLELTLETGKGAYLAEEQIRVTCRLVNRGSEPVRLKSLQVAIAALVPSGGNNQNRRNIVMAEPLELPAGGIHESAFTLAAEKTVFPFGPYGIYSRTIFADDTTDERYRTFFRIVKADDLVCFAIDRTEYEGYPVYILDGGMSAEYAVLKSGEALAASVSPSWVTKAPGYGPRECMATPEFLLRSVDQTVRYYDAEFGSDTPFDTVFLATGVSSMAYMARTLQAPVLPLHFLAAADTAKEIETILAHSSTQGISAYATLGHDASVDMSVAWVKLLDLPPAYRDFLVRHQVRQVLFMGCYGLSGGENAAKKVLAGRAESDGIEDGDLFIMHPYGGTEFDEQELGRKIKDLADLALEPTCRMISDWESGIVREQIERFTRTIRTATGVQEVDLITADTYLDLYNLATYAMLAFYKKNEQTLSPNPPAVRGLVLNPYLIGHPFYETTRGMIPFVFFQGEAVDRRLGTTIRNALSTFYPDVRLESLPVTINTTRNFGGYALEALLVSLRGLGFHDIAYGDQDTDEVWNPDDGMNAPAEAIVHSLVTSGIAHAELAAWGRRTTPLNADDLRAISTVYPAVRVIPLSSLELLDSAWGDAP